MIRFTHYPIISWGVGPMVKINLAVLLAQKKWKITDLHKATGIRYMTLNDLFNEFSLSIKIEHIDKICDALGCAVGELIEHIPSRHIEY
jgi:putative transcriptional regulator